MSTNIKTLTRRIVTITVAVAVFFAGFSVMLNNTGNLTYAAGETGQITATKLYVRSGAGTNYSKLGYLTKGKTFTVTGTANDRSGVKWYKLKYNSKNGYVSSKYVYIKQASVSTITNTVGTVITKKDPLTVRSGPGAGYTKLGTIAKGKTFSITGKATDSAGVVWYRFTFGAKTGYVSSVYVKTSSTSKPSENSSNVTPLKDVTGTVITKKDPLTVRSGAGSKYSKLGTLAKGKTFPVSGQVKDSAGTMWYQLVYNGKTAYVSGAYVKITQNTTQKPGEGGNGGDLVTPPGVTFKMGIVTTESSPLNVRSGAGSTYSLLGTLAKGTSVTITGQAKDSKGKVWYTYQFSSTKTGYICSDYVKVQTVTSDSKFEAYMDAQGFPESYKPGLRSLHAAHPTWTFKAANVGVTWTEALNAETKYKGTNLVSPTSPVSYRNPDSYNSSTGVWARFDGDWYSANKKVVAHYMDPRNFLNDNKVYQFMTHEYDASTQNLNTVNAVAKGTFLATRNPGCGYSSYPSMINAIGKSVSVNPNVLAAMIIQEQGTNGTSPLISGTYSGYKGYYNFFNVGAFASGSESKVVRGLKYAKTKGWSDVYKSILGGAEFYANKYVKNNQDTYYTKKFNIMNGAAKIGTNQYMTNAAGAAGEGSLLRKAFLDNSQYKLVFEIPVYKSMPATPQPLP